MTYSVKLDVFEGPLDLLLQLVSKHRVNVEEVSISTITDEYLKAVRSMGVINLDLASSFLVLAATLLELKSTKLLPGRSPDPAVALLLEERDRLIHRLIEYATFKEVSHLFSQRLSDNKGFAFRTAGIPEELHKAAPDPLSGLNMRRLARAGVRMFAPKAQLSLEASHVTPIRISVADVLDSMIEAIQKMGRATFEELCKTARSPIEVIVRFLSVLELFKNEMIEIEQRLPFGEIVIHHRQPHGGNKE